MRIYQTKWQTGALPKPKENQVLVVKYEEINLYQGYPFDGQWVTKNGNGFDYGEVPTMGESPVEWSIIRYCNENTEAAIKEFLCPKCQSDDISDVDDKQVYYDGENLIEVVCNLCRHSFKMLAEVAFSIHDDCLDEE